MNAYETVGLGGVCELVMGQSPSSDTYNFDGIGLPFFQGNADFGEEHPTPSTWCSEPKKTARKGDILISVRAPIGAVNTAIEECCIGRGVAAIRPDGGLLNAAFLKYHLIAKRPELERAGTGSTFTAVGKKALSKLEVRLYSLDDQLKMSRRLDDLSENIRTAREQLAMLDYLVKSRFIEMFGDVRENPRGYRKTCLRDVAIGKLTYGANCPAIDYDGCTRYLRITDIKDTGGLNEDAKSPSVISEKYVLTDGDILFARSGATVGKTYRYRQTDGRALYAGYLIRLTPNRSIVLPDYLFWYTKTDFYKSFLEHAQRAVAQPNINAQQYGSLEILLPPLDAQRSFVAFVNQVNKLRFDVQQQIKRLETLKKSLMQEYFG